MQQEHAGDRRPLRKLLRLLSLALVANLIASYASFACWVAYLSWVGEPIDAGPGGWAGFIGFVGAFWWLVTFDSAQGLLASGAHGLGGRYFPTKHFVIVDVYLTAFVTVWRLGRLHRLFRPQSAEFCRECGYDLRATPHRCPECGTPAGFGKGDIPISVT